MFPSTLAEEVHRDAQTQQRQAAAQELASRRSRVCSSLVEDIEEDAVNDIVQEVAIDQMR